MFIYFKAVVTVAVLIAYFVIVPRMISGRHDELVYGGFLVTALLPVALWFTWRKQILKLIQQIKKEIS